MPNYRCLIRGYDFPGEVVGAAGLHGFWTTRWVHALTVKRAELHAINAVWRDPKIVPNGYQLPGRPHLRVETIERIEKLPRSRGGGATWFVEEGQE